MKEKCKKKLCRPFKSAREHNPNAWTPETIESMIHQLNDIMDMGWQLRSEHDNCIDALHAKLKEQDLLTNQLKDDTAMLMQQLRYSSAGVHQFYKDFSLHMKDSIKLVQAFKDLASHICHNATTTSGERENIKKNWNTLKWRGH